MRIGELAKRGGVSVQTVRYYERYGLLRQPEREPSRYRLYCDTDVYRLRFIRQAKALGFTLDEINHILELRKHQACPCGEVRKIGEDHLAELEAHIAELNNFRNQLARAVKQWKNCPDEAPAGDTICILIERTMLRMKTPRGHEKGVKGHAIQTR